MPDAGLQIPPEMWVNAGLVAPTVLPPPYMAMAPAGNSLRQGTLDQAQMQQGLLAHPITPNKPSDAGAGLPPTAGGPPAPQMMLPDAAPGALPMPGAAQMQGPPVAPKPLPNPLNWARNSRAWLAENLPQSTNPVDRRIEAENARDRAREIEQAEAIGDRIAGIDARVKSEQGGIQQGDLSMGLNPRGQEIGSKFPGLDPNALLPPAATPRQGRFSGVTSDDVAGELRKADETKSPNGQPAAKVPAISDGGVGAAGIDEDISGIGVGGNPNAGYTIGMPSQPTHATRAGGSTGNPTPATESTVEAANKLNAIERFAEKNLGIDSEAKRQNLAAYLADWGAYMAGEEGGILDKFAGAHKAGREGALAEKDRQAALDEKREMMDMRREEAARARTGESRAAERHEIDMANARGDLEWEQGERGLAMQNPTFYYPGLNSNSPDEYEAAARMYIADSFPTLSPEEKQARLDMMLKRKFPPKQANDLASIMAGLGAPVE